MAHALDNAAAVAVELDEADLAELDTARTSPLRRWSRSASWNTVASTAFPWIFQIQLHAYEA